MSGTPIKEYDIATNGITLHVFIWGKADGLRELYPLSLDQMRAGLPGLMGGLELDNVGHWVQHEAAAVVNEQLVTFLRTVARG